MFTVTQLNAGLFHDINLRPSCIDYEVITDHRLMGCVVNELKHFGGKTCFMNVHIFRGWDGETKNDFKTCVPQVLRKNKFIPAILFEMHCIIIIINIHQYSHSQNLSFLLKRNKRFHYHYQVLF